MQLLLKKDKMTFYLLEESQLTPQLEEIICGGLVTCFPNDVELFSKSSWWHSKPSWRILAMTDSDTIAGHIAMIERPINVGNLCETVQIAGVQSVFVMPNQRGTGLSAKLLQLSMANAIKRKLDSGVLFCVPELEKVYAAMGWHKINDLVYMQDDAGKKVPLPSKNITMIYPIDNFNFPPGIIHLNGHDW